MDKQTVGLRIEEVADGVWVFDDEPLYPGSLRLPIRMVVLRLTNGDLILHSPRVGLVLVRVKTSMCLMANAMLSISGHTD